MPVAANMKIFRIQIDIQLKRMTFCILKLPFYKDHRTTLGVAMTSAGR